MGLLDFIFKKKNASNMNSDRRDNINIEHKTQTSIDNKVLAISGASGTEQIDLAIELLSDSDYKIRGNAASQVAESGITALGVVYKLVNRLADDNEYVRSMSAKALWKLNQIEYAICSLRDEYDNPANMTKNDALKAIQLLQDNADNINNWEALYQNNWKY